MLSVIACNVLEAEVRHLAADLPHIRELFFMPQGLHNEPVRLQRELQAAVNRAEADPGVDAIALVYGLCSRGVENLRHERCPIVIASHWRARYRRERARTMRCSVQAC